MPELRDLLHTSVDPPAPLDIQRLGHRVARHRRRRRKWAMSAAAIVVMLAAAAGAALIDGDDDHRVDVDIIDQPSDQTTTNTGRSDAARGSVGPAPDDLPNCAADQVDFVPGGEGATAQTAVGVEVSARIDLPPCSIDTTVTIRLLDRVTEKLLDAHGNPVTVRLSGTLGDGQRGVGHPLLVWSGCVPGDGPDDRSEVIVEAVVDGFGTYRGTTLGPRCGDPRGGSNIGPLTGPPD